MASAPAPIFDLPSYVPDDARPFVAQKFADAAAEIKRILDHRRRPSVDGIVGALASLLIKFLDQHPAVISARIELPDPDAKDYGRKRVALHNKRRKLLTQVEGDVSAWVRSAIAHRTKPS